MNNESEIISFLQKIDCHVIDIYNIYNGNATQD